MVFHLRDFREVVSICSILTLASLTAYGQNKRIAVYDFNYSAVKGDVVQVYGSDKNVGAQAANRIISKLVGKGTFEVIDRSQIDALLREQNQKFSDRFDPRDAPKLGKLLNVDAIITGSVDALADEVQNNRVGLGPIGLGKAQAVAEVTMSVRVISTQTAQIFMAEQVNNKQKHELGKGARVGNSGGDGGSLSQHPAAMAANLAVQAAADDIASKILAKAENLPARTGGASSKSPDPASNHTSTAITTPSGGDGGSTRMTDTAALMVGRVDAGRVYLTGGENAGVKLNDYYEVRRVTGKMKDPSGNEIETDERVETIVVTDVQDKFSVAKAVSGTTTAKVGDKLKKSRAPAVVPPKKNPAAVPPPVQRKQ